MTLKVSRSIILSWRWLCLQCQKISTEQTQSPVYIAHISNNLFVSEIILSNYIQYLITCLGMVLINYWIFTTICKTCDHTHIARPRTLYTYYYIYNNKHTHIYILYIYTYSFTYTDKRAHTYAWMGPFLLYRRCDCYWLNHATWKLGGMEKC